MLVEELKEAMWNNALVKYQGGLYKISAAIYNFDRKEKKFYYRLEDVEVTGLKNGINTKGRINDYTWKIN